MYLYEGLRYVSGKINLIFLSRVFLSNDWLSEHVTMDKYSMRLITSWLLSGITILQSLLLIQSAIVNVITFCNQVLYVKLVTNWLSYTEV